MDKRNPQTAEELAADLAECAAAGKVIRFGGVFSKDCAGGPIARAATVSISTANLRKVRQYEPKDLTISVEAGLPWAELAALLESNRQMIPLDPPWFHTATVGGVVATNFSGPRRRGFGTVRDHVIGMSFATLEGKLVQSGGMVVKNVAGLDMGKLLIGSWGTLGAMTSVNFKLTPRPDSTRTFLKEFAKLEAAVSERDRIIRGVLQPWAVDLLNPAAALLVGRNGWTMLIQAGGTAEVMERYTRELPQFEVVRDDAAVWEAVREFPARQKRVAARRFALTELGDAMKTCKGAAIARAGSGILYEAVPDFIQPPEPEGFEIMRRVKMMFDPQAVLNPGRLNGLL